MIRMIALSVAALAVCPLLLADEKPGDDKAGPWRALFDGKTLKNWKSTNFGGEGSVDVEERAIVMGSGSPMTGITWTGKPLPKTNYEVQLDARRVQGSDFFCALTFPIGEGYASLVLGGWGGAVIGLSSIDGSDASENETTDFYRFKKGQWYKVRVKVTDAKVQAWLDDEQIVNVTRDDKTFDVRIEVELSKPFGISTYETTGAIRNLRLRALKPSGA